MPIENRLGLLDTMKPANNLAALGCAEFFGTPR